MIQEDTKAPDRAMWCGVLRKAPRIDLRMAVPYASSEAFWAAEHFASVVPYMYTTGAV